MSPEEFIAMSTSGQVPRPTVLLAADAAERIGLVRALADGGFSVTEADEADEALRRAAADRPHVVLLGAPCGSLAPSEVGRRLRADPATANIPVVLLAPEGDRGADGLSPLPAPAADLVRRVRALVQLHRAEEQARAEAEEAHARLAAVLDSSEDAIVFTDLAGGVTGWNAAAERLYGYPADEVLGRPTDILVPADRRDELKAVKDRLARGEPVPPLETVRVCRDGRLLGVSLRFATVRGAGGAVSGFLGISRDLTERRRAAQALRESEERYRSLFERNPHPMFVYDCETLAYLAVNDAAVRQYGYTREEFLRMTLADIRPLEDMPALLDVQLPGQPCRERRGVWRHRKKDGSLIDVDAVAHPLPFGDRPACIMLAYDVTERRRLEEQFLQSQKMEAVGRLAGGVAHDFNNLLTVINGYADILVEDLGDRPDCAAHARAILTAGERAAALTQQLLAFGRKQIVTTRLLDLNAVVAHAGELLGRLIGEDVLLDLDLPPGLGRVRADPTQLEQMLLHLAVNARDAMPRGGRLSVATREMTPAEGAARGCAGRHVLLTVADTGHGMTAEVRRHLFEPFFTTKEAGKGTGLGLATVYAIVQQAGGHIEVESAAGDGTTFRIFLPCAAEPEPRPAPAVPGPRPSAGQTVLLTDDEDGVRALARQVLESAGYVVLEAASGEEALGLAEGHAGRIDVLVSDVVMPGMGGRELAECLRARDPALRVLYLSGHTEDEVVRQGVLRQELHFLAKPFSPAALTRKVREILGAGP
jgi:PAS domain S-box-containing protein